MRSLGLNCRGHNTRVKIVDSYNIVCSAHIQLLAGQTIHSDAEREIERDYYVFICTHKITKKEDRIICGGGAARDLLALSGHTAPPIFNMLHGVRDGGEGHEGHDVEGNDSKQAEYWEPASKQLYNAIMILITAWGLGPGPIYKYLEEARKYKGYKPFPNRINRINKILERHDVYMNDILMNLRETNPNLRDYQFNLLTEILEQNGITSRF